MHLTEWHGTMSLRSHATRALKLAQLGGGLLQLRRNGGDAARRATASASLVRHMASLRGLPQKIGQILHLGELSNDSDQFAALTERGEPVPVAEFTDWLRGALGSERLARFAAIEPLGWAASIGQVHRASLTSGEVVAVKVQYPEIGPSVGVDLKALGLLTLPLRAKNTRFAVIDFDLAAYRHTLGQAIVRELDYTAELNALVRAKERSATIEGLLIPTPYPELCSPTALTMSWSEGKTLREAAQFPISARQEIARILLRFFLYGWLEWGELHADPHPGNFRFESSPTGVRVTVLDFGSMYTVLPTTRQAFLQMLKSNGELPAEDLFSLFCGLGFSAPLLEPITARLPELTRALIAPFVATTPRRVSEWRISERLAEILGEDRWNFRLAGPPEFTFFIRAFAGLLTQLDVLGAAVNMAEELHALPTFRSLPTYTIPPGTRREDARPATHLRILVTQNGEIKAQVTMPGHSAENLAALIPDDVLASLPPRGIDVEDLSRRAKESGFAAQQLFSTHQEGKLVKVWLE